MRVASDATATTQEKLPFRQSCAGVLCHAMTASYLILIALQGVFKFTNGNHPPYNLLTLGVSFVLVNGFLSLRQGNLLFVMW